MGELNCQCCGLEFKPTCHKTKQKFCSKACRFKYNNAKRYWRDDNDKIDNCPQCKKKLEPTGERGRIRIFCCDRCRRVYHYKKQQDKKHSVERPKQLCPNCGQEFTVDWGVGNTRRFCCDNCRLEWWAAYHKEHKADVIVDKLCVWCGKKFSDFYQFHEKYCCATCSIAAQRDNATKPKARRYISYHNKVQWQAELSTSAKQCATTSKHQRRVYLVCGITSMYIGLDGLVGTIEQRLQLNAYDGSIYAFCDTNGTMLKYLQWDGVGFTISKRRAQSGSYPWPPSDAGAVIEISEKEFLFLRQKSIAPIGIKKL